MNRPAAVPATPEQAAVFAAAQRGGIGSAAPLPGFTVADLWNSYTPPQYLVKRLLGPSEVTVLFGQSGHFKSVIAVDLALSVAAGVSFHGMRTRKAGVLYVAGEGHGGLRKRLRAWLMSHDFDAASERPSLYVTTAGTSLIGNPAQISATAERAAEELGVPIELVIIDTLSANFGPGAQNDSDDMEFAVGNARRSAPTAAIMLVHHTGHVSNGSNSDSRERGSYALIAAADYRVRASYDEASRQIEAKWLKCKEDDPPAPLVFTWRRVPLEWRDVDGEELASVVLDRVTQEGEAVSRSSLGKNQQLALRILQRIYAQRQRFEVQQGGEADDVAGVLVSGWRAECGKAKLERNRFAEAMEALREKGCIAVLGESARPLKALA